MFTNLSPSQRIQIGLILAMAFLLVFASNRLDQRHFSTVQNTVNSVHKDRVVVQDLIYQLNKIFHTKELRFIRNEQMKVMGSENQKVEQYLSDFRATDLTSKELNLLNDLDKQFSSLTHLENIIFESPNPVSEKNTLLGIKTFDKIELNLDGLAQIQIVESSRLTKLSKKSLDMNTMLSKLEFGFLVLIGIALLVLIFYPSKQIITVS